MDHTTVGKKTYDTIGSIEAVRKLPRGLHRDIRKATALARRFCDEVVRPHCKNVDLQVTGDNDYIPEDFIREACRWGLYTLWIPKLFGGKGMHFLSLYLFIEEISSVCAGLANVLSVHYGPVRALRLVQPEDHQRMERGRAGGKGKACLIPLSDGARRRHGPAGRGTDPQGKGRRWPSKLRTAIVSGRKIFISAGAGTGTSPFYEDLKHRVKTSSTRRETA